MSVRGGGRGRVGGITGKRLSEEGRLAGFLRAIEWLLA